MSLILRDLLDITLNILPGVHWKAFALQMFEFISIYYNVFIKNKAFLVVLDLFWTIIVAELKWLFVKMDFTCRE